MDERRTLEDVPPDVLRAIDEETPMAVFRGTAHPAPKRSVLRGPEPLLSQTEATRRVADLAQQQAEMNRRDLLFRKNRELLSQDLRRLERQLGLLQVEGMQPKVDELIASGSVEVIDSITVRCLSRAYLPQETDVKRIEWMGRVLSNVASSFIHNLRREQGEPVYLERAVVCDEPISEAGRDKFLALAGERGQALLTELDSFLAHLIATDGSASGRRYGLGVYFFDDQLNDGTEMHTRKSHDGKTPTRTTSPVEEIDVLAGLSRQK